MMVKGEDWVEVVVMGTEVDSQVGVVGVVVGVAGVHCLWS